MLQIIFVVNRFRLAILLFCLVATNFDSAIYCHHIMLRCVNDKSQVETKKFVGHISRTKSQTKTRFTACKHKTLLLVIRKYHCFAVLLTFVVIVGGPVKE